MFLVGVRSAWALLLGVALLSLGNGLQGTLLGVRASTEHFGTAVTGIIMSGYSIGFLISSFATPRLVSYVGHIRVFAAFASIASTAVLLFPIFVEPIWWFCVRILIGFCVSGLFIVAESWLNSVSTNKDRGQILSVYMIISYACVGMGQILLNLSTPSGFVLFLVVSGLVSTAMVPMTLVQVRAPVITASRCVSVAEIYARSPLALVCAFANGLGQSALFYMGAVYGTISGLTVVQVSFLMAFPPLGVILSQFPIGVLSDRLDRRKVLTVLAFIAAVLALACYPASTMGTPQMLIVLFGLFGAVSLPLYALALSHANDNLEPDEMLGASGKLTLIFSAGAIVGPLLVGQIMSLIGATGFPIYLAVVYAGMGAFALYRMSRRAPPPVKRDFVHVSPLMNIEVAAAETVPQRPEN